MPNILHGAAALILASAITSQAPAQRKPAPADQIMVTVRYADLDLQTATGNRALQRRLGSAIEQVCGSYAGVHEDSELRYIGDCRNDTRRQADRQLHSGSVRVLALLRPH